MISLQPTGADIITTGPSIIAFTSHNWPLQYSATCVCGSLVETFDRVHAELWTETHMCEVAS